MRKSRTITLLLLGGSILSFSLCVCAGCGQNASRTARVPYDPVWHDAEGKPIAKEWVEDADGKRRPAQTPYDANGKPIPFDETGNPIPPAGYTSAYSSTSSTSYRRHSNGVFLWPWLMSSRSSGYSSSPTYRSGPTNSGPTNTGSTYFGGSKPGMGSPPSTSSKPSTSSSSSGSISRGGFGGSAAAASSSSSS